MTNDDLGYLPATQLAELIRTKKLSPVEYMQALLARIRKVEPKVNAFVHLAEEHALNAARQAEQVLASGAPLGRLHGVPVTIKDLAAAGGMPMQSGSHIFKGNMPEEETPMVTRLRNEGAIVLGKTTTSEFAHMYLV